MRILLVLTAALLLLPVTSRADEKSEFKKLAGKYKVVSMKNGGKDALPAGFMVKLTVEKNQFILSFSFKDQERKKPTTVKLDDSKKPKEIDFLKSDGTVSSLGIYKLEGKKLIVASQPKSAGRPKKFESPDGSKTLVLTFEREK